MAHVHNRTYYIECKTDLQVYAEKIYILMFPAPTQTNQDAPDSGYTHIAQGCTESVADTESRTNNILTHSEIPLAVALPLRHHDPQAAMIYNITSRPPLPTIP